LLENLEVLGLAMNRFVALPEALGACAKLERLHANGNPKLQRLPLALCELRRSGALRVCEVDGPVVIDATWPAASIVRFMHLLRHFGIPLRAKAHWLPDSAATECMADNCTKHFGWTTRRHHCRVCAKIFCREHCDNMVQIDIVDRWSQSRLCNACIGIVRRKKNSLDASSSSSAKETVASKRAPPPPSSSSAEAASSSSLSYGLNIAERATLSDVDKRVQLENELQRLDVDREKLRAEHASLLKLVGFYANDPDGRKDAQASADQVAAKLATLGQVHDELSFELTTLLMSAANRSSGKQQQDVDDQSSGSESSDDDSDDHYAHDLDSIDSPATPKLAPPPPPR
jgi:FYVE zinc finger